MSAKELREKLKKLRDEHAGKPVSRMSPEEMQNEIEHHEVGCKTRALKKARMEALAKAREARSKPKEEEVKVKVPAVKKEKEEPAPKKTVKAEPVEEKKPMRKGLISID